MKIGPQFKITQDLIDAAYAEGKRDYNRWYGSHGPTLKPHTTPIPENPFTEEWRKEAWQRGWNRDCRRLIAPL